MSALLEFVIYFIREVRCVFPVVAVLLCMCLFIYGKSDVRKSRDKSSKTIIFLLCSMLEAFLISVALVAVAAGTRHLPVRAMAISCVVVLWVGILSAIHRQIQKKHT